MATPVTSLPLTIYRSVAFEFRFRYKDSVGELIDIGDDPLVFAYRNAIDDTKDFTPLFEITLDDDATEHGSTFVLEDEEDGKYLVTLTNPETAAIAINDGYWWLRRSTDDSPALDKKLGHGPLKIRNP